MRKIFCYELRRAVCNKFFVGLLAVCLFFGWQTLGGDIIRGISHTAPFSPWSYGYYLAQTLPLLAVALFFLLWGIFSQEARRVGVLTAAAPVDPASYLLIKCSAVVSAWLLLALSVAGLGVGFLVNLFGTAVSVHTLLLPLAVTFLPALLFTLGLGMAAGQLHPALLFVFMCVVLALSFLPLPALWDLFGKNFFTEYPLSLGILDPAFAMTAAFIVGKVLYASIGMLLIFVTIHTQRKRN